MLRKKYARTKKNISNLNFTRSQIKRQMKRINHVVTMATAECAAELGLMLHSLCTFNPDIEVTVGVSSDLLRLVEKAFDITQLEAPTGEQRALAALKRIMQSTNDCKSNSLYDTTASSFSSLRVIPCLDKYGHICRRSMEQSPGVWYPTKHCDFMMEKANLIEAAMLSGAPDALFLDCDITCLAELPLIPLSTRVGLSPHNIRKLDTDLFGFYNGGWVYMADTEAIFRWRKATISSRYFDQASLEDVAHWVQSVEPSHLFHFPQECNVGYWRVFQSDKSPREVTSQMQVPLPIPDFSVSSSKESPLQTLQSVHTHFHMPVNDRAVPLFNRLVKRWTQETPRLAPILPLL